MPKHFYLSLAVSNIRKNGRFYLPFLLTCLITVAMFYIMCATAANPSLPGGGSMAFLMALGVIIIGVFSTVFLYYTNSFLIKRRKRELGLYNILGMEKRHIGRVLAWESLLSALISIGGGLVTGIVLNRLMYLLLLRLIHFEDTAMSYYLGAAPLGITAVLFGAIFALLLLSNMAQIRKARPAQLLAGSNVGEREPKTKWLLVVVGLLALGGGYALALGTESLIAAVGMFFVAVLLVIIGTFCLFTAGSVALLKYLKKRPRYYYQPKRFISVSGLLFRMKQNAAGLANICILSCMVLVAVSTTISLYVGMGDILDQRFPREIMTRTYEATEQEKRQVAAAISDSGAELGLVVENMLAYESMSVAYVQQGDELKAQSGEPGSGTEYCYVEFYTADNFYRLTGQSLQLKDNQVALYVGKGHLSDSFSLLGREFQVAQRLEQLPIGGESTVYVANGYHVVVSSEEVLRQIQADQLAADYEYPAQVSYLVSCDLSGGGEEALAFYQQLNGRLNGEGDARTYIDCRQMNVGEFYQLYGGFLFLGMFCGLLFLMATALIMYYKQISEGYDDAAHFGIMRKVGLDKRLIASSVRSQMLLMFALPLAAAFIHLFFAFPMLTRMLFVLNLNNIPLFAWCTLGTAVVFSLFYAIIYWLTAGSYYRIVSGARA